MIFQKTCEHTHGAKQNVQVKEVDGIRDKVIPGVRAQEGTAFKDLCHSEFEFFLFLISILRQN